MVAALEVVAVVAVVETVGAHEGLDLALFQKVPIFNPRQRPLGPFLFWEKGGKFTMFNPEWGTPSNLTRSFSISLPSSRPFLLHSLPFPSLPNQRFLETLASKGKGDDESLYSAAPVAENHTLRLKGMRQRAKERAGVRNGRLQWF